MTVNLPPCRDCGTAGLPPAPSRPPASPPLPRRVAVAAQVLGDPALRSRYDQYGSDGLGGLSFMDGPDFYSMLFGSEQFDYLVGELAIATAAR